MVGCLDARLAALVLGRVMTPRWLLWFALGVICGASWAYEIARADALDDVLDAVRERSSPAQDHRRFSLHV